MNSRSVNWLISLQEQVILIAHSLGVFGILYRTFRAYVLGKSRNGFFF